MRSTGRVALVTGAGAGIGEAIAEEWAAQGGTVIVTDVSGEQATTVCQKISSSGGQAWARACDVRRLADIESTVSFAVSVAGGVDALFNVAGVNLPKDVEEIEDDEWSNMIELNLTSVYRFSKRVIPVMRTRRGGAIVNIASIAGLMAEGRCSAYTASKAGVVMLTRNMAMDFARDNIRVNAVCPGSTMTPRIKGYREKAGFGPNDNMPLCPMARYATAREIALPAIFLASEGASYITGAALPVDGGLTAGFRIPSLEKR